MPFTIDEEIKAPIYVYYQLDNFYQNHRRYVKSRDNSQLAGTYKEVEDLDNCDPIVKVGDLWPHQQKSVSGKDLADKEAPAIPCGLVAKSLFNDTFTMSQGSTELTNVEINSNDIAWSSDVEYKFKNIDSKDHPVW